MTSTSSNTILVCDSNDNDPISGCFLGRSTLIAPRSIRSFTFSVAISLLFKNAPLILGWKANKAFNDLQRRRFMSRVIKPTIQIETRAIWPSFMHALSTDTSSIRLIYVPLYYTMCKWTFSKLISVNYSIIKYEYFTSKYPVILKVSGSGKLFILKCN